MQHLPETFWDQKILQWEQDKYFANRRFLANLDVNTSVKARMNLARSILKNLVPGLGVVEIGCGSALLMEDILSFGAKKYIGIDVSPVAIAAAKQRALKSGNGLKAEFLVKNINDIEPINADICFSLGLFDWISLIDLTIMQKNIKTNYYFHSFSEKKSLSLQQALHRLYVYLMYGHKNRQYVPQYFTEKEITGVLNVKTPTNPQFLRNPKISFGCIAYNLPQPIECHV